MIGAHGTATAMDTAIAIVSADTDTAAALGAGTITTTEAPLRQNYLRQKRLRSASAKPGEDERAALPRERPHRQRSDIQAIEIPVRAVQVLCMT